MDREIISGGYFVKILKREIKREKSWNECRYKNKNKKNPRSLEMIESSQKDTNMEKKIFS